MQWMNEWCQNREQQVEQMPVWEELSNGRKSMTNAICLYEMFIFMWNFREAAAAEQQQQQ